MHGQKANANPATTGNLTRCQNGKKGSGPSLKKVDPHAWTLAQKEPEDRGSAVRRNPQDERFIHG